MREPNSVRGAALSVSRVAAIGPGEDRETRPAARGARREGRGAQNLGDGATSQDPQGPRASLGQAGLGRRHAGGPLRGDEGGQRRPLRGGRQGSARAATPGNGDENGRRSRPDEGRGDEARPVRLLHRHRIPAGGVRRDLPGAARETAHRRARRCPGSKVAKVLDEEYDGEPLSELFADFEEEAFAAASIGQVHRAELLDGRPVAVKVQYPGIAEALDADLRNVGTIMRLARALAPGLDAKAIAKEIRERMMEELDYEYEAQNQRTFARAYREHPFIYVPEVITRLSRRRVLVTELVEGIGFEEIKELAARGAQPLRRDRLPRQLRLDLPPAALQRRPPSRQLPADGRRPRRLPRLRHDQEARPRADRARAARDRRRLARRPGGAARGAARPRLRQEPLEARRRAADGAHDGGRLLVPGGPRDRNQRRGG